MRINLSFDQQMWFATSFCVATVIALVWWLVVIFADEAAKWDVYSKQHDCQVVAINHSQISVATGFVNGQVATGLQTIPETKTYKCNNGLTITR